MKWIIKLLMRLPAKKLADIAVMIMREIANRTDNKIDDEAVEIVEDIIEMAFESK